MDASTVAVALIRAVLSVAGHAAEAEHTTAQAAGAVANAHV